MSVSEINKGLSGVNPTASSIGAVPLSGGIMTGPLILSEDPVLPLQAATKQYVDTNRGSQIIWGYQDFVAGAITTTSVTLTANQNGAGATLSNFMNYASVYRSDIDDYVYSSGFLGLFAGLVSATQSGTAITLNKVPANTIPVRIWFLYIGLLPTSGYILPPQNVLNSAATIKLDEFFATDADLLLKAPLNSPALTGIPTAPTSGINNSSTTVATTAYADRSSLINALIFG